MVNNIEMILVNFRIEFVKSKFFCENVCGFNLKMYILYGFGYFYLSFINF